MNQFGSVIYPCSIKLKKECKNETTLEQHNIKFVLDDGLDRSRIKKHLDERKS
jgi:hypothetical protein